MTLPPASRRYCDTISIGPWPMSTIPFQVPTSDFIRSNSVEPGLGLGASPALEATAAASSNVVQMEVIFVFIVFLWLSVDRFISALHHYNERAGPFRTAIAAFLKKTDSVKAGRISFTGETITRVRASRPEIDNDSLCDA